jgi:3D-(3,5/4)-trihydroxycyclohexane-1,2-dione acylhydrolase (decyclizing)
LTAQCQSTKALRSSPLRGAWTAKARDLAAKWNARVAQTTAPSNAALPSDAQVLRAVNRAAAPQDVVVGAAGGLPGELHNWTIRFPGPRRQSTTS